MLAAMFVRYTTWDAFININWPNGPITGTEGQTFQKFSDVKMAPPADNYTNYQIQSAFVLWWHVEFTDCK